MSKKKLTYRKLHKILNYNLFTGLFINKINRNYNAMAGSVAGYKHSNGYIEIKINSIPYKAHRLAWFYVYGYLPEHRIDHKDKIKHHNWISNLREASNQCNIRNSNNRKDNKSGVKGVYWDINRNKWIAQITVNQKILYLGRYKNFHNTVCARLAGEQCLKWESCNDLSSAYEYVMRII